MTDPIHEQLSAFHDGELSAAESELLLKRVQRDPQLRAMVGRYALIGEALRSTEAGGPSRNFAARVAQAIEREETPRLSWRPVANWLKPVAGGAIAAGVAAVALVSLRVSVPESANPSVAQESVRASGPQITQVVASEAPNSSLPRYTVPLNNFERNAPPVDIRDSVRNNGRLANYVTAHNVVTGLLEEDPAPEPVNSSQSPNSEPAPR
jgi:sigma-E factor negative regulatory protein RseA